VAAIGRERGIPVPLNEALWRAVKALERKRVRAPVSPPPKVRAGEIVPG